MVSQASDGLDSVHIKALRNLVHRYKNIWRVKLSADGPAKVTPLKIHLKPDAIPRRAKAQRYAPKHLDFMRKYSRAISDIIHCRWSSLILVVPKPKAVEEFRMTVDTLYPSSQIVPIAGVSFHSRCDTSQPQ